MNVSVKLQFSSCVSSERKTPENSGLENGESKGPINWSLGGRKILVIRSPCNFNFRIARNRALGSFEQSKP